MMINSYSSDVILLVPSSLTYPLYRRRFYVLFLFCFLSFNQCLIWLTFSPISQTSQIYYQIDESTINLLLNWGPILFLPVLPFTYVLLNKPNGLQTIVRLLALLCFLSTLIRIIPLIFFSPLNENFRGLSLFSIHLGQMLNAICGPFVMAPVSQLSCLWFGPNERTRATTISILSVSLGSMMAFLLSPSIVDRQENVPHLLYFHLILSSIAGCLTLIYFPSHPPMAPSYSAQLFLQQTKSEKTFHSLKMMMTNLSQCLTNRSFLFLCSIGGLLGGAFAAWTSLLSNVLAIEKFSERQSGWIAFSSTLASIVGGLSSSCLADTRSFRRSFQLIIIVSLISCFFSLLWFQLSIRTIFSDTSFFPTTFFSISLSVTLAGLFQGAVSPLVYEALAEIMFPLPESLSASVLVQLTNLTALILLFIPPSLYNLMNFLVIIFVAVCILMASFVQIDYKRRNEDERKQ